MKLLFVAPPSITTVVSWTARRSRASASVRLAPTAMILAIIESKSAGIVSPSPTPVSTRMPGPDGSSSSAIRPGEGAKSRSGSSALSRASIACPISGGLLALEARSAGDPDLRLHQVDAGGGLGDRVLDLQPGVHLEEGERLLAGVVQELHRGRAHVADRERQPLRRRLEVVGLLLVQERRRGLLDHLLVAALHRAVADPERPGVAVAVGDHLHLDVPRARDQPLEEDHAAAEGPLGLVAGALVGVLQVGRAGHHPDPPATAAGGRLEHQRVPHLVGGRQRLLEGVDATPAPGRDRDADLLGDQLRPDLVAQLAHRLRARTDEGDAEAGAEVGEARVLRHEAPADPDRVRPRLDEGALEHGEVEVGPGRGGTERVGDVRLPHEHGGGLGVGVERDGLDRLGAGLAVEIAHRVDQPHGCFPAVDDRDTRERDTTGGLPAQWSPPETRTVSRLRASHLAGCSGKRALSRDRGRIARERVSHTGIPGMGYELVRRAPAARDP